MANMGLAFGLEHTQGAVAKTCKRKGRWLFMIDGISAQGIPSLPPMRSSRPSLTFRENEVRHLNETIYMPIKPEWKPVSLTLYDLQRKNHPIFAWMKQIYNPRRGEWFALTDYELLQNARLVLYNGCGVAIETWVFEEVWPQTLDFGELEMGNLDIMTCELTLRYARAYIEEIEKDSVSPDKTLATPPRSSGPTVSTNVLQPNYVFEGDINSTPGSGLV